MNVIVEYDPPKNDALRRLIRHSSGEAIGLRQLRVKIDDGAPGTRFLIADPDGEVLIEGTFYGDDRDRDWPLVSARIFAGGKVNPAYVTYADGVSFAYSQEFDAVMPSD